jgi:glyoxylase-like metal-dependent hydrolase (beta-lactamase superfamily II)
MRYLSGIRTHGEGDRFLHNHYEVHPYVVFYSHYHWDHIWGTCVFESASIIAHTSCRELIKKHGEKELAGHEEYMSGEVTLVLPALTFSERLIFWDDDVMFFHSPGHTPDSATCFDTRDRIVFAGDNVESPIPYLFSQDLTAYVVTLEHYLDMEYDILIPGHGSLPQKSLIAENLAYIRAIMIHDAKQYEQEPYRAIHNINMELQKSYKKVPES